MINKLMSPTPVVLQNVVLYCKDWYRVFTAGRSSLSSTSYTWGSFSRWVLGITSWMWVSYSLTCVWEEVGEGGRAEVAACLRERELVSWNARILSVSRRYGVCLSVLFRIYFILLLWIGMQRGKEVDWRIGAGSRRYVPFFNRQRGRAFLAYCFSLLPIPSFVPEFHALLALH